MKLSVFIRMIGLYLLFVLPRIAQSGSTELTWIEANHEQIRYTGRIDFSDVKSPRLFWPGTYIRATFSGTTLKIILDDKKGESYYNIIIDGQDEKAIIIDCEPGLHIYDVCSDLQNTDHNLLIFRRTEASTGPTIFKGLILDDNAGLRSLPPGPARKIEFYGNSITCAMGNEADPDSGDSNFAEENNYLSYAAITARNLEAEYVCIAKSGIGIMVSWFDLIMPNYYYRLDPDNPESKWDFSRNQPDVVVINLLQNDSWLFDERLDPVPTESDIINAYIDFVSRIRGKYTDSFIICILGTMDAIAPGKPWPGYVITAVDRIKTEYKDHRIRSYIFEYTGFDKHPRVVHHKKMAQELTNVIKKELAW